MANLQEQLRSEKEKTTGEAIRAIDTIINKASGSGYPNEAKRLTDIKSKLTNDSFRVIVVGKFNAGKSTSINAILGKSENTQIKYEGLGMMPVDRTQCTAILTNVTYADKASVTVHKKDGKTEEWSYERYMNDATVKDSEEETRAFFENIISFTVKYPSLLLKAGVTLTDSPGLDDVPDRDLITKTAIGKSDAAIMVMRDDQFGSIAEMEFYKKDFATFKDSFVLVNVHKSDELSEREKQKIYSLAWDRLLKEKVSKPYSGQTASDFRMYRIYFVDAKKAFEAKMKDNTALLIESGFSVFEEDLGRFLTNDSDKFKARITLCLDEILSCSSNLIVSTKGQRDTVEKVSADNINKIKNFTEELKTIKESLPSVETAFEEQKRRCMKTLETSFKAKMADMKKMLPVYIDELNIESFPSYKSGWRIFIDRKELQKDMFNILNEKLIKEIESWSNNDAADIFKDRIESAWLEVKDYANKVERKLKQIQIELGTDVKMTEENSIISRVGTAALGLLLGGVGGGLVGGVGGGQALKGALVAQFVAGAVLAALHIAAAPFLLPVSIIASLLGAGTALNLSFENSLKKKAIAAVLDTILTNEEKWASQVTQEMEEQFEKVQQDTLAALNEIVNQEIHSLNNSIRIAMLDQGDKEIQIKKIDEAISIYSSQKSIIEAIRNRIVQSKFSR